LRLAPRVSSSFRKYQQAVFQRPEAPVVLLHLAAEDDVSDLVDVARGAVL
jgi:hypothetical protein